jgi:hypothetical protein
MPFLNRQQIQPELRRQGEQALRDRLRRTLDDSTLPAERRKAIRAQLTQIGKAKTYASDSPARPGAVENKVIR